MKTAAKSIWKKFIAVLLSFAIMMGTVFDLTVSANGTESDRYGWEMLDTLDPSSDEYAQLKEILTSGFGTFSLFGSADVRGNYMSNDYIALNVANGGRFTIGTTGGNPNDPNDDNKTMLYGHPGGRTSYTTIRVDGTSYAYDTSKSYFDGENACNTSSNIIGGLNVEQKLSIIENSATGRDDVVEIKYTITNNTDEDKTAGLRIMLDTMLGSNDSAPFRVPQYGSITTETEFVGDDIPQFWQAFDSLTNPTVIAQGRFYRTREDKPDKVQFTNWSRAYGTIWGYNVKPGYGNGDSAVSMIWNEAAIAPGETREYVTYYGLSEFTEDLSLPLALSVYSDNSVDVVNNQYVPNPVDVTAYVQNLSRITAENVKIEIELPDGLELASGDPVIEIGEMSPNQLVQLAWSVNIKPTAVAKDYQYKVILTADNDYRKVVSRVIHVPALKQEKALEYTIFSGSDTSDLNLYGWKSSFTGNVYTGRNFNYNGSEFYVDGRIDAVGTITTNGWKTEITERREEIERVDMPDFDSAIHNEAAPFETFEESPAYVQDRTIIDSSIKVNGDAIISGTTFEGDCYIIAEGNITYNVQSFNTLGRVVLYSRNGNITINGSSIEINGILYAPNGSVDFNTYETTLNGRVFADKINFNGSIFNINGRSDDWELIGGGNTPVREDVSISAVVPQFIPGGSSKTLSIINENQTDGLVYSAVFDGLDITVDENGTFGITAPEISGEYILTISASAPNGGFDSKSYTIIVDADAPVVRINSDRELAEIGDEPINVTVSAVDDYEIESAKIFINGELSDHTLDEVIAISTDTAKRYVIRAEVSDAAGNITVSEKEVEVIDVPGDTENPTVDLSFDKDGYYVGDIACVTVTAQDNIGVVELVVTFDGERLYENDGVYTTPELTSGTHIVEAVAYDAAGNMGSAGVQLVIEEIKDNTPPEVTIDGIIPSEIYVGDTVTVFVSVYDESGITELTAEINGVSVPVENGKITYIPEEAGSYDVTVTATDTFGNTNTASASFEVSEYDMSDTEPPLINATVRWYGEALLVNEPFFIIVDVEDNSGEAEFTVSINGEELSGSNDVFEFVPKSEGSYTLEVFAVDPSGNSTTCSYTFYIGNDSTVDGIPPQLSTTFEKFVVLVGDTIRAAVEASDNRGEAYISVTVNDIPVTVTDGIIEFVPDSTGKYEFVITAADEAGNTTVAKQIVSVVSRIADTTPPVLGVSGLPSHIALGDVIEAEIVVFDDSEDVSVSAFVNGEEIDINNGILVFEAEAAGEYLFAITATDEAGNEKTFSKTVIVTDRTISDTTAPELEIVSFPAQARIGEEVKLVFRASDDSGYVFVIVTVNGEELRVSDGTAAFTPRREGDYEVVITAYDKAGNTRTASGTVTVDVPYDNTIPTMSITGLTHFMTLGEKLSIGITASDDSGRVIVLATINGKSVEIVDGKIEFAPDEIGIYKFIIRAEDLSGNYIQNEYDVLVTEPITFDDGKPVVTIYANNGYDTASIGETIDFMVTANDPDGIASVVVTINGEEIELDEDGKASFTPAELGRYTIAVKATDTLGNEIRESVKIIVADPADRTVCDIAITSPADGGVVTSPVEVTGTVSGEGLVYYALEYCPADGTEYTEFASGNTAVSNGVLGTFDPTLLENGYYKIRLSARSSNYIISDSIVVSVEGQMKIGNYSIAFQDMDIPVAGYPLTVIRGYDSRRKTVSGDFGYGWDMTLSSVKLSESCEPGLYWTQETAKSGFVTKYYFAEDRTHEISIDYGNGKTDKFKMKLSPNQQNLYPIQYGISASYVPQGNTKSKLEVIGTTDDLIFTGNQLRYEDSFETYDPEKYKLTRPDGTVYIISAANGVESITDTNGNVITFTANEVKHSDGKSIVFERDSENRVTKITDPYGKTVQYTYNSNGDLSAVTDKAGETTTFKYDRNHYLTEITDPRGIKVARNEYDDNGRLIATVDANGNRLEFSHDIDGKQDVVTDRLGHTTVYIYDNRGNVISETDALGNTTLSEYDSYGNLKSRTDALGNVTTYNYDAQGNLLSLTNALGQTVNNTYSEKGQLKTIETMGVTQFIVDYDDFGNLTSTTDAEGNETAYKYDRNGRVVSITDGIGSYMKMSYDSEGRVVSSVNGNGETVTFTYDSEGNCASKTITRTTANGVENLTEKYAYDVYGNVTQIIYADGSVTNTEYDSVGNMTAAVDSKGRRTTYDYDLYGNLIKITYCDNTSETFEYDAENRNIKATDRLGRTVEMTYDAVGNLVEKTYPNGSKVSYVYDAKYRLVSVTEANGGTTEYEYDVLDRNTAIIDAMGNRTEFGYSTTSGQLETMTDAKGNTYTYGYDLNGNRTSVTMPDGTTVTTAYDARGRVVSQTDQHGYTTKYTYDGADRLTSVTDALGSTWRYAYDSVGELISITDANGNTTRYKYDSCGRVIKTTNAKGSTATVTYDEAGNVLTSTDYAGITTSYAYDTLDRVVSKTVGSDSVFYTYTDDGMLSSVSDKNGTITYTYDLMSGLKSVTTYDGSSIEYSYDNACRLTEVKTPFGTTKYEYDLMDRLVRVVAHDGTATLYEYDANGNRTAVRYANGIVMSYEYDEVNRLVREKVLDKNGASVVEYSYTLGAAGERLKVVETGRTVEYEYDELYRLTKETVTDKNGTTATEYTYDRNSNRLTKTVDGEVTEYAYNELNQLVSETGISYEYDLNGNLVKKTEGEQTTTYTYNAQNRLTRVTVQSGQQVNVEEYRYDYAGNRIAKVTELDTINYLVDTNGALSQVLAEYDENGSLTTYYTRGAELISQERNGAKSYYLYDGFDSVRILTDEGGTATDFYAFDAFGNLTEQVGDTENSYLYRGEQFDSFTGLYYLRARYMNPATGTFITMDEYAGSVFEPVSLHKYLYANANPVMYSDPSGYFSLSDVSASLAINNVLQNMGYGACMGAMLNGMLSSLLTSLRGGTFEEAQQAFLDGMASGFIFGGLFGGIGAYANVYWQARLLLAAVDFMGGYNDFRDAVKDFSEGNILAGIVDILSGVQNAFSSANGAREARGMYGERLGKQNSTPKTADNSIKGTSNTPKSLNSCSPQEISNMNRKELKNATPSNWKFYDNNGRIHIKDENQIDRVRVDPPDKKTPYTHIHIYDSNHNLVDINGNPVSDKDINGHIPYIY